MTRFFLFSFVLALASGCGGASGVDTPYDSFGSGGSGGVPQDDGVVCEQACNSNADCCVLDSCPGAYPNNWACIAGSCAQVGPGCVSDAECPVPDMQACRPIGGIGNCVYPCSTETQCAVTFNLQGTKCQGEDDNDDKFCSQYDDY